MRGRRAAGPGRGGARPIGRAGSRALADGAVGNSLSATVRSAVFTPEGAVCSRRCPESSPPECCSLVLLVVERHVHALRFRWVEVPDSRARARDVEGLLLLHVAWAEAGAPGLQPFLLCLWRQASEEVGLWVFSGTERSSSSPEGALSAWTLLSAGESQSGRVSRPLVSLPVPAKMS